jgi:hypothetical protein
MLGDIQEMATIAELVTQYKQGEMDLNALLTLVPTLEWGKRHEEADGEIWWDGENTVGDVDVLWYENTITDEEREAILSVIP